MALTDNDFISNEQAQAQAQAQAQTQGVNLGGLNFGETKKEAPIFSFSSGLGFEDVGQLESGSVVITALKKSFEEKFKDTNIPTKVIPLLRESYGEKYRYSSLIVASHSLDKARGVLSVAYHIMLVEASNPIKPEAFRNGNTDPTRQINIPRFASDAIDADYVAEARRLVERTYSTETSLGAKHLQAIYASSEVIPDTLKVDEPEVAGALAVNGLMAVMTQLGTLTKKIPFNLAKTEKTPFVMEHIFRDGSVTDLNGSQIRSDMIIKTVARTNSKGNGFALNGGSGGVPLSLFSMYIDTVFKGRKTQSLFGKKEEAKPCFVPRAVITNNISYRGYSLEMFLMGLYTAYSVYETGAARRSLATRQVKKGDLFDMSDIGAFNVLANLGNDGPLFGPVYSVRGADVNDSYRYGLLDSVLDEIPLMAIDCPSHGPSSWQTSVWQQAAEGVASANTAILTAAMNLTDGKIAHYIDDKTPILVDRQVIPLGHWQDGEGNIRDIREFDTLAILNRFNTEHPEQVSKWIISQNDKNRDDLVKLTDMMAILDDASSQRARYTGRALRVTLNPAFMIGLSEAIKNTDHTFTPADMYSDSNVASLRGADFLDWGQLTAAAALSGSAFKKATIQSDNSGNILQSIFNF